MIPRPPEGLHSLFKDREKITQILFFSRVIKFFEKQKPFFTYSFWGFPAHFHLLFLDEILILATRGRRLF